MATQRITATLSHPSSMVGYGNTGFSPTGKSFFSAGGSWVRIWTMDGTREKKLFAGHLRAVPKVAFHPNKPILASLSVDQSISFWNLETGEEYASVKRDAIGGGISFSPDGSWLATGFGYAVGIWNMESLEDEPLILDTTNVGDIYDVRFSNDGKYLAVTGQRGTHCWHADWSSTPAHPQFIKRTESNTPGLYLRFDSSSNYLATASNVGFRVWDLNEPTDSHDPVRLPNRLMSGWHNLAFHPRRPCAYGISADGLIESWDVETKQRVSVIEDDERMHSFHIAIDPTGRFIAADSNPTAITLFHLDSGERLFELGEESAPIWGIDWDRDGNKLALSLSDGGVVVWYVDEILNQLEQSGFIDKNAYDESNWGQASNWSEAIFAIGSVRSVFATATDLPSRHSFTP